MMIGNYSSNSNENGEYFLYEHIEAIVHDVKTAHQPMLLLCSAIFLIIFVITIYSIIKHRRGLGQKKKHFHKSIYIEIMWAVIPFLIIVLLVCPIFVTVLR
jgi:cytochrome c oxidase subunit 2